MLTSTLSIFANWIASSLLIVDKPPFVDPHSELNKVTFSFLLEIKLALAQPSVASCENEPEASGKDEP